MEQSWSAAQDLAHFKRIWEYRRPDHKEHHTKELWDRRAHKWAQKLQAGEGRERCDRRVAATVDYLRTYGLLDAQDDVIDVGCGPGRFVAEFAKTARHVVGTDLSSQMLAYGAQYAKEQGADNTSYVAVDFKKADLDELGWRNRFDLVFSSITPAIGGDGFRKLMEMSREWCFNSCIVRCGDELDDELARNVLGLEPQIKRNVHLQWFYALFNLLLLEGYLPEVTYYKEEKRTVVSTDGASARVYAGRLAQAYGLGEDRVFDQVAQYLERHADVDGQLTWCSDCWYGWILWNVNSRDW